MKKGRRFGDIVSNVYLILLSIVAVFPLLWLLVSAFKSSSEMLNNPTKIWPIQWTLANFKTVLFTLKFTVNIRNSLCEVQHRLEETPAIYGYSRNQGLR